MKCSIGDCDNQAFEDLNKCVLHCEKECIHENSRNTILSEFNRFFKLYIIDKALSVSGKDLDEESYRNEIVEYRKNNKPLHQSKIFREKFCEYEIGVHEILFPNTSLVNYTETLIIFKSLWFEKCVFYVDFFNLKSTEVFFEKCVFKCKFHIKPMSLFLLKKSSIFDQCIFEDKVYIGRKGRDRYTFEESLFSGCSFGNDLVIESSIFKKEVISYDNNSQSEFFSIEISKCIFEDKIKINNMNLACLSVEDTEFQSKLEVKETTAQVFIFKNSNVSKVFDLFGSSFIKAEFSKSIFNDFAGFEDVQFGSEQEKGNKEFLTIFKYVTFMDFSSFRGSKFNSGLDFSKTNLKDKPNFLSVYVDSKNTKRETFRIIKNSFDDAGNNIEENKFFVEEMKAYRKELKANGGSWFERFILFCNRWISNFGSSYIMPIGWLIVSILIFSEIIEWHSSFFNETENTYFWHSNFDYISIKANNFAKNFLPFSRFLTGKSGIEFVSLLFYIWFAVLIWQTIVAVKRHTQR